MLVDVLGSDTGVVNVDQRVYATKRGLNNDFSE